MNPRQILTLDRIMGTPACFLLTLVERIRRLAGRKPSGPPRRILFIKLIEMGSTVLACPAFDEATQLVGKDNLFFLAFAQNRPIVDMLPYFEPDHVITIDDTNLFTFALGLLKARARIRRENIDVAIDMEGLTRSSAVITYLTGTTSRVGYHNFTSEGPYRGRLFTHELNYTFQHHISEAFVALVRSLSAPPGQIPALKEKIPDLSNRLPHFTPTDIEEEEVKRIVDSRTGKQVAGRIVLLNPNCSELLPLRRWPAERFITLGKRILETCPDVTLCITGAPGERAEAEELAAAIGPRDRVCSMAGHTTLRQVLTLYCLSTLLVSNDSGPCHFASLTPVRVIALFGPETPLLYSPLGNRHTAITANLACSPCVNMLNHRFSPCNDNLCMQSITVDEVASAALACLGDA